MKKYLIIAALASLSINALAQQSDPNIQIGFCSTYLLTRALKNKTSLEYPEKVMNTSTNKGLSQSAARIFMQKYTEDPVKGTKVGEVACQKIDVHVR